MSFGWSLAGSSLSAEGWHPAHGVSFDALASGAAEKEFVYQNSMRLNAEYYASQAGQKAFVV